MGATDNRAQSFRTARHGFVERGEGSLVKKREPQDSNLVIVWLVSCSLALSLVLVSGRLEQQGCPLAPGYASWMRLLRG